MSSPKPPPATDATTLHLKREAKRLELAHKTLPEGDPRRDDIFREGRLISESVRFYEYWHAYSEQWRNCPKCTHRNEEVCLQPAKLCWEHDDTAAV
jgi:hypothetical protein